MNGIIPQGRALAPEPLKRLPFRGRAAGYETILSLHSFGNEQVHCSHFIWESGRIILQQSLQGLHKIRSSF